MNDEEFHEYIDALIGEDEPEEDEASGERFGFGVCATGRCDEPCGEHGGCARGSGYRFRPRRSILGGFGGR